MSSECTLRIPTSQNIHVIHNRLKEHIIIYNPPYSIANILTPYMSLIGREIKVVIEHASRNVHIIEGSIRSHVLQTTILAFQQHRLSSPFLARQAPMEPIEPPRQRLSTGKECPICYDVIYQDNMTALPCAHLFHRPCIQTWLNENPTCPVCRNHV